MSWTREKLDAGFAWLQQEQFEKEGGKAHLPVREPDQEKPLNLTVASELKRHVTREMAEAAGHDRAPPLKVIRAKCIDCCGGSRLEVSLCSVIDCPNWPYRFGKNPFNRRSLSPERRAELAERMRTVAAARPTGDSP